MVKKESGNASAEILQKKSAVMKDVRFGESDVLTYKVQGWRQSNGELWKVNTCVKIKDSWLEGQEDLVWIVAQISYSASASGTTASLTLKVQETFDLLAEKDSKKVIIENTDIKKDSGRV